MCLFNPDCSVPPPPSVKFTKGPEYEVAAILDSKISSCSHWAGRSDNNRNSSGAARTHRQPTSIGSPHSHPSMNHVKRVLSTNDFYTRFQTERSIFSEEELRLCCLHLSSISGFQVISSFSLPWL